MLRLGIKMLEDRCSSDGDFCQREVFILFYFARSKRATYSNCNDSRERARFLQCTSSKAKSTPWCTWLLCLAHLHYDVLKDHGQLIKRFASSTWTVRVDCHSKTVPKVMLTHQTRDMTTYKRAHLNKESCAMMMVLILNMTKRTKRKECKVVQVLVSLTLFSAKWVFFVLYADEPAKWHVVQYIVDEQCWKAVQWFYWASPNQIC